MSCVGGWSRTWPLDGEEARTWGGFGAGWTRRFRTYGPVLQPSWALPGLIGIEDAGAAGHLAFDWGRRVGAVGHGEVVIPGRQAGGQRRVGEQGNRPVSALGRVECVVIAREKDELTVARDRARTG